jgi:PAS domain S-box-containing protein
MLTKLTALHDVTAWQWCTSHRTDDFEVASGKTESGAPLDFASLNLRLRSGDAVCAFDSGLAVVGWNKAAERLTGSKATEVLGRLCWEVLGGVDQEGHLVCHVGCSIARSCAEGRAVSPVTLAVRAYGTRRLVRLSTVSLVCDEKPLNLHVFTKVSAAISERLPPAEHERSPLLTPRQHEVLRLLAEGFGTGEIAARLAISPATVRNHVRALLIALDCHSRLEAVAQARALGLL